LARANCGLAILEQEQLARRRRIPYLLYDATIENKLGLVVLAIRFPFKVNLARLIERELVVLYVGDVNLQQDCVLALGPEKVGGAAQTGSGQQTTKTKLRAEHILSGHSFLESAVKMVQQRE
jgi:hypothetical protein